MPPHPRGGPKASPRSRRPVSFLFILPGKLILTTEYFPENCFFILLTEKKLNFITGKEVDILKIKIYIIAVPFNIQAQPWGKYGQGIASSGIT